MLLGVPADRFALHLGPATHEPIRQHKCVQPPLTRLCQLGSRVQSVLRRRGMVFSRRHWFGCFFHPPIGSLACLHRSEEERQSNKTFLREYYQSAASQTSSPYPAAQAQNSGWAA